MAISPDVPKVALFDLAMGGDTLFRLAGNIVHAEDEVTPVICLLAFLVWSRAIRSG
jgi:hypothetical protein